MKPAPFTLHEPSSVAAAVALLAEFGDDAKILAGGQSLTPMLAMRLTRFDHLVDLSRVDALRAITAADGLLTIGAMTPQAVVERDPTVHRLAPLVAEAVGLIGHRAVRTRGTIGGSLAHADPASELPAVALALDAELTAVGPGGERRIPATDFFLGTWTTALADDEILTAVTFPAARTGDGYAIEELARRHGDFALAGAVAAVHVDAGTVTRARLALFGLAPQAMRAPAAEAALTHTAVAAVAPAVIGATALTEADPGDDLHATAQYRRQVGAHLVALTVARAITNAQESRDA